MRRLTSDRESAPGWQLLSNDLQLSGRTLEASAASAPELDPDSLLSCRSIVHKKGPKNSLQRNWICEQLKLRNRRQGLSPLELELIQHTVDQL